MGYSVISLIRSVYVASWPTTPGEIISVGVDEEYDSDGDTIYKAKIEYRYSVDGLTYRSNRLAYGLSFYNIFWLVSGAFLEATKIYPKTIVKYNPNNPGVATLISGVRRFHIANIMLFFCWNWLVFTIPIN